MSEKILEAIIAILGADVTVLFAYLAYISPKHEKVILERRNLLDGKLSSKIDESKSTETTIELFLPLFKEYEIIEKWAKVLKQICVYLGYSAFLTVVGLFFCLFDSMVVLDGVPIEVLFIIGGGIYFLFGLFVIISHAIEVNKWKVSKKR